MFVFSILDVLSDDDMLVLCTETGFVGLNLSFLNEAAERVKVKTGVISLFSFPANELFKEAERRKGNTLFSFVFASLRQPLVLEI